MNEALKKLNINIYIFTIIQIHGVTNVYVVTGGNIMNIKIELIYS